jgi:tetratricopeptide (TPR) repeat protein
MNSNAHTERRMLYFSRDDGRYVVLALLLMLLLLSHERPQHVSPLQGLSIAFGVVLVVVALVLLRWGSVSVGGRGFTALLVYSLFLLWAWRSASGGALVAAFARDPLGTYLEGFWILVAAYLALAPTRAPQRLPEAAGAERASVRDADEESRRARNLLWMVALFFAAAAVLASGEALNQYLWKFARQLKELDQHGLYMERDRLSDGVRHALKERRVVASFGNPNIFCGFLAFSLPFILAALLLARRRAIRLAFLVAVVLVLGAGYLTRSRAGMLSLLVSGIITVGAIYSGWVARRKGVLLIIAAGFAVVILVFVLISFAAVRVGGAGTIVDKSGLIKRLTNVTTFRERLFYAESGLEMIRRAPVGGNGLAAYGVLYPTYRVLEARESQYAHNFVVQMLVEMGGVGLALFVAFIVLVSAAARRAIRRVQSSEFKVQSSEFRALVLATLVGFFIFLFNSLLEYTFYFREFFLDFCLMSGVLLAVARERIRIVEAPRTKRLQRYIWIVALWVLSLLLVPAYIVKPFLSSFHSYYGDDALIQKDVKTALGEYERAVALQPDNPWLLHKVARTLFSTGQQDEALATMRRAIALNPYSAYLHDEMATLYREQGLFPQAIGEEKKAIQKYPYNARYHYRLAQMEMERGDSAAALREAEWAARLEQGGIFQSEYDAFLDALRRIGAK